MSPVKQAPVYHIEFYGITDKFINSTLQDCSVAIAQTDNVARRFCCIVVNLTN